jgi:hypothetical protein
VLVGQVVDVAEAVETEIEFPVLNVVHLTMFGQLESFGNGTPWRSTRGFIRFVVDPVTGQEKNHNSPAFSTFRTS